eukprot:1195430-Prorocentrum_minimum.AAC.7
MTKSDVALEAPHYVGVPSIVHRHRPRHVATVPPPRQRPLHRARGAHLAAAKAGYGRRIRNAERSPPPDRRRRSKFINRADQSRTNRSGRVEIWLRVILSVPHHPWADNGVHEELAGDLNPLESDRTA